MIKSFDEWIELKDIKDGNDKLDYYVIDNVLDDWEEERKELLKQIEELKKELKYWKDNWIKI